MKLIWLIRIGLVIIVIISFGQSLWLHNAREEIATLTNTLTACRNTPDKLAKELTKEEMAAEIARTKKEMANRAWGEYLRGRPPCPDGRECK